MINKGLFFFIGKPSASANYIHVDNVAEGLVLCGKISAAKGRVYNLSDYRTIEKLVAIIADSLRKPIPRLRAPETVIRWMVKLCGRLPHFPLTESRMKGLTSRAVYSIERIKQSVIDKSMPKPHSIQNMMNEIKNRKMNSIGPLIDYITFDSIFQQAVESIFGFRVLYSFIAKDQETFYKPGRKKY